MCLQKNFEKKKYKPKFERRALAMTTHLSSAVWLERPEHEEPLEEDPADVHAVKQVAVPGRHGGVDGLEQGAAEHGVHLEGIMTVLSAQMW